ADQYRDPQTWRRRRNGRQLYRRLDGRFLPTNLSAVGPPDDGRPQSPTANAQSIGAIESRRKKTKPQGQTDTRSAQKIRAAGQCPTALSRYFVAVRSSDTSVNSTRANDEGVMT